MGINLTEHYGLKKPEKNEFFDVEHQNENMDAIDAAMKENVDAMLKKDGSVQMTGMLKTVGSVGEQISFGNSCIYADNNGKSTFTILCNAYRDGNVSKYKQNGKAYAIEFGTTYSDKIVFYTAVAGLKDEIITWVSSDILTSKTGLPLTGGTLTGSIDIVTSSNPYIRTQNTSTQRMGGIFTNPNGDSVLLNQPRPGGTSVVLSEILLRNPDTCTLMESIMLAFKGTLYYIYGTHNITVSTSAPSSALANGAQHQVY